MQETPQELKDLYEVLKESPVAQHFKKINWIDRPFVLSIRNAWGDEYNDLIIHIWLDDKHPGKFKYDAICNKGNRNPEKYLTVEEKGGVSGNTVVEVVTRLLTP